ncbi:MAG: histidine kinase [Dysgonamonadaceae bacterium]|nr:histidine kinase [Dysgonamonadaceae bacterium]MDD4605981.1 histidine kinase [Dysgonamonadaceae bacterium]
MKSKTKFNYYFDNVFIHLSVWIIIFGLPLFLTDRGQGISWSHFSRSASVMLAFMIVFYINYLYLIDRLLYKQKTKEFIIINLLLIIGMASLMYFTHDFIMSLNLDGRPMRRRRRYSSLPYVFIGRNLLSLALVVGLSVAIKMSARWAMVESERKELEKAKTEAELKNLKSQINPHFLLNTLNNIYALIEFNPPKAQTAVEELSKLLRHLLYDNNETFVPLMSEVEFIKNYIELMRIRLSKNITLTTTLEISPNSATQIAPLIYISLIENAFKHGVSGNKNSFIDIQLKENPNGIVEFICKNSYFPKSDTDKSGSGIGLNQVKRRLELLYPDRHTWNQKIEQNNDENIFVSHLTINTK